MPPQMDETEDPSSPSFNLAVDEVPDADNNEQPLNLSPKPSKTIQEIRESARSVAVSSTKKCKKCG